MKIKTLKEIKTLKNKRVLVRCDFNVPLKKVRNKLKVADPKKIQAAIPTIKTLQNAGAIIILASHLGQPHGRKDNDLSLFPVADYLSKRLFSDIIFVDDFLDANFAQVTDSFEPGQLIMLENLRFHLGEERNSPIFAKKLASLADVYVNDAFAASHRDHASLTGITKHLPSFAGLNLEHEVNILNKALKKPPHPALAIVGGAKFESKLPVIENLARKFDLVVIAGAIANNFLKAIGYPVGKSMVSKKYLESALGLLNHKTLGKKIIIPLDVRVAQGMEMPRKAVWRRLDQVKKDEYILDIGPRTARLYSKLARHAKLVVWAGPLGLYENKYFHRGTYRVARAVPRSHAYSIIGGGETLDILKRLRLTRKISHVSTGGGAMLEFLAGNDLPGLKALIKK